MTRAIRRIDVHHHIFPSSLPKAALNAKMGWKSSPGTLPWSPEVSIQAMDAMNIDVAILSYPPGFPPGPPGEENRKAVRQLNLEAKAICERFPGRFGFFGVLPDLRDVEGTLEEIAFLLDELRADGVGMGSSYGEGQDALYIGHDKFDPIWEELNRRQAVVHLHGNQTPSSTPYPHETLGIPIVEVPNETFKAASHLITTLKKRLYPHIKIILAHLGGSTPILAPRVAVLSNHMGCPLSPTEILDDFKSFYFDTALSASDANLDLMDSFVGLDGDRLLFGTDFPAVGVGMVEWYTERLVEYFEKDKDKDKHKCKCNDEEEDECVGREGEERLEKIMVGNAKKLFPRFFENQ